MMTVSRSRRFVPSLDRLQSRVVLSLVDVAITPMDLVLFTPDEPPGCEAVITPMDSPYLGSDSGCIAPAWSIPAGASDPAVLCTAPSSM
ncbi:MAG: hypothetical protein LC745_00090 [Planctomycetia bacterium]|nr:hypothetical protein [Planctomycetia bacterium]